MTRNIEGKQFVMTGRLDRFKARDALKVLIEEAGGIVANRVTESTDYLITNTPDSGTKKNRDARALGVKVITEQEFYALTGILD